MLKFFVNSFTPKRIFTLKDESLFKTIIYFIFLVIIISFPLNLQIIRSDGWDLYDFTNGIRQTYPDWIPNDLPEDIEISSQGMYFEDTENSVFQTTNIDGENLYIVFSPLDNYTPADRTLGFAEKEISYYGESGEYSFSIGYSHVKETVRFYDLKLMTQSQAVNDFAGMIEEAFSPFAIFKSITYNLVINLVLNVLLVVVVSAIFLLFRVRYQKITNFKDNIRIVVASMTIPTFIGFIIGIIGFIELNAFSVVIFQFATPIIGMISIYKGASLKEINNKYI